MPQNDRTSTHRFTGDPMADLARLFPSLYRSEQAKADDDFFARLQAAMWPSRTINVDDHKSVDEQGRKGFSNALDGMLAAGGCRGETATAVISILRGTVVKDCLGKLAFLRQAKALCSPTSAARQDAAAYRRLERQDRLKKLRLRAKEHRALLRMFDEVALERNRRAAEIAQTARRAAAASRAAPGIAQAKRSDAGWKRRAMAEFAARRQTAVDAVGDAQRRTGTLVDTMRAIAERRSTGASDAAFGAARSHTHLRRVGVVMGKQVRAMVAAIGEDRAQAIATTAADNLVEMAAVIERAKTMDPDVAERSRRLAIERQATARQAAADRSAIQAAVGYLMRTRDAADPVEREAVGALIGARARTHGHLRAAGFQAAPAVRGKAAARNKAEADPTRPCRAWCEPETHAEDRRDAEHDKHLAKGDAVVDEEWKRIRDERRGAAEAVHAAFLERCMPDLDHAVNRKDKDGQRVVSRHGRFAKDVIDVDIGHQAKLLYVTPGLPADGDPEKLATAFGENLPIPHVNQRFLLEPMSQRSVRFMHVVVSWPSNIPDGELTPTRMVGHLAAHVRVMGLNPATHRMFVVQHNDKSHRHAHAWIDRVDSKTGEVWTMNAVERTVGMAMGNSLLNAAFIRNTVMDGSERTPTFHAPVYGGKLHGLGMSALHRAAAGTLRCDLLSQDVYEDPDSGWSGYAQSTRKSPMHGGHKDGSKDSRRDLFKRKLLNDAMEDLGIDGLAIPGGFAKIDDIGRGSLDELTANEKTHQNTVIRDNPDHTRSWLYEAGDKRRTTMKEHLARKLAPKAA